MNPTRQLHDLGQSLWLDNITRDILNNGTLKRYIDEWSVTGLTSNPTIFDQAIKKSQSYDPAIHDALGRGLSGEALFFELALEDLTRAADLFRPIHDQTKGGDGWVSLEVSPLLAYDTAHHAGRRQGSERACGPSQPVHQDSGNSRRAPRNRRSDLCRSVGERHAAVFARALCRRCRSLPEGR